MPQRTLYSGDDNEEENNEGKEDAKMTMTLTSRPSSPEDHRAFNELIEEVSTVAARPGQGHTEEVE